MRHMVSQIGYPVPLLMSRRTRHAPADWKSASVWPLTSGQGLGIVSTWEGIERIAHAAQLVNATPKLSCQDIYKLIARFVYYETLDFPWLLASIVHFVAI